MPFTLEGKTALVTGAGGGNPFVYRVDYFTYPAFRTFSGMFELGF